MFGFWMELGGRDDADDDAVDEYVEVRRCEPSKQSAP